jgi:hypothetical protein
VIKPIVTLCVAALISSASAAALSKNDEAARDAAVQWLQLIDARRNDEAASQASTEVRSFEQWQKYFADRRAPLGRARSRQFLEMKHRPTFPGASQVRKYYVIRFKTSFEVKPTAIEEVALTKIGCCWEIFDYKVE